MFGVACDRRAFFCQSKTRGLLFFNGEPCILLDGTNRTHAGIVANNALDAIGELIAIKGLAFEDFNNTVQLTGGTNHVLQGNQFGASTSFSSTILASNDTPILLASDGTSIGGLAASHANLITGAIKNDISIGVGSDNNVILCNQIGYDSSGIADFGSSVTVLPNRNFVVTDLGFSDPLTGVANVGAAHLFSPTGALISTLRGATLNDLVAQGIIVLANGNYQAASFSCGNLDQGAVTFCRADTCFSTLR